MDNRAASRAPVITGLVFLLIGLVLAGGGLWLASLGGSWFYLLAGLGFITTAALLWMRRPAALLVYAALLLATLAWSLWEAGLDWWPLATRLGLLFLLAIWLLLPWVRRGLVARHSEGTKAAASPPRARKGWIPLAAVTALVLLASVVSWTRDAHRIDGRLPAPTAAAPPPAAGDVPPGEWHAYGRTGYGQRYSPLRQITPANLDQLEVAWTYRTGDVRGRPGDPEETTFEVTPLKIDNRLFLCTPHQSVIAVDATTGEEVWRLDPRIQEDLALQHLTCRGLSWYPGTPAREERDTSEAVAANTDTRASESADATTAGPGPDAPAPAAGTARADATTPALDARTPSGAPVAAAGLPTGSCTARLFMPTADGRLIAINPNDGRVCEDFGNGTGQVDLWRNMPEVNPGSYYSTSPPVVAGGLVIIGGTVLDNVSTTEPSGVIRAFDARTGELVWNWDPGDPEDTLPIAPGETYSISTPNSWSISSVDEALGLVYIPMGNQPPDQWGGNRDPEGARYSSSVVALDIATGQLRWVFQTVHHDLWDYDVPAQPSLIDLDIGGETVPALVQPTKQGEIFVLDRRTGEPVLPVEEVPVPQGAAAGDHTAPTQPVSALSFGPPDLTGADMWGATLIDQMFCRIQLHKLRYEGRYTPPSEQGSLIHPGNFGVFNWGGVAVDPVRQVAFATPAYLAFTSKLIPREDDETLYVQTGDAPPHSPLPDLNENFGAPFAVQMGPFLSPLALPCHEPPWGYVAVADLTTGEVVWQHRNGTVRDLAPIPLPFRMGVPGIGGPMMTAGGVAFYSGAMDYYIRGYDVATGEELWQDRLPAGGQATPMTYQGADGRQYLLVIAGGHGSTGTKTGDYVIAYALPGDARP
ncbi:PQQ-binding-like beta-propeller repeat protein [Novilysobacter defluvii]|uniref:Glucose dehydrogenase n=1 Tax=Lysobacter defluvii IMMIB APB-9 = DSM 18482 TaxID=1385515 RepID=A0A0A0M9S0_9GAMM|nr:PQQ-binding-like beta-propeller repeat protein [Lysobacter defluvii]KGO99825.1 glucose dehydrogenase [Lysobacter defluvii IMMIB APB-9 = DSM 18482]